MDINSYIEELPSVEAASFDEYAKLMQLYILTAKKSDSFEGTKRLLTELYPDNAHFIYELLQNAEDAEATNVRFEVFSDKLLFKHDGKRIFTLKDVKGITNIGNSTKKEDHTKVGKFGVGFKSVFAFTDTPRIYSKDFNFEIQDMLLPVKIDAEYVVKDEETVFVFPFKGDDAEKKKYLFQIEKELKALDSNTIMFLDNINFVEYTLADKSTGYVRKSAVENKVYKIEVSATHEESYWLIFQKNLNETDYKNKLHVNISFGLKRNDLKWRVVPVKGSVNIFFPAVMEKSGLRFNINGPFASTVARDSVRDCEENGIIFDKIKILLLEALVFIKENGMMDINFYEVMPNNEDLLEGEYGRLRDYALSVFNDNSLVLGSRGEYYKASELIRTIPAIQDLFAFEQVKSIMCYSEMDWSCLIPPKSKNCRAFFDSLTMRIFSYRTIAKFFDEEHRETFAKLLDGNGLSWYRNFYLMLMDLNNHFQEGKLISQYASVIACIKETKIILNDENKLITPTSAYLSETENLAMAAKLVNRRLVAFPELQAFWMLIGISEYDNKATINELVKKLEKTSFPSEEYFADIMTLVKNAGSVDLDELEKAKIWFSNDIRVKYSIKELYLDLPYLDTGFSNIASVIDGLNEISASYFEKYTDGFIDEFLRFVSSLGIATKLEIVKCDVKKNPLYHEVLYKYSDNVTALSTGEDYSIVGLEELLKAKNIAISRMIWNYIISLQSLPRYCKASFSPNRTTLPRKCDSSLIQLIREQAWIPNKHDNLFYKPADISREQLFDDFEWIDGALMLNLILFGTDKNKVKIQSEKLINDWGVDTESEQAEALRALLSNPQMAGRILNLVHKEEEEKYNLTEAISAQTREGRLEDEDYDDEMSSVRNTSRRAKKIEEELEEGLKKPASIKKLGLVARTAPSKEERLFLEEQYHGRCQICGKTIRKWNGAFYFEGINLIDTKKLDDSLKHSLEIGWNSLCLCPNHVAEYKYGAIDLTSIEDNIENTPVFDGDSSEIALEIMMQGEGTKIMYSPKHFLALKTAFAFFKRDKK